MMSFDACEAANSDELSTCVPLSSDERLRLVSSLYGPGVTICWICVVLFVLVSWTVHKQGRARDTITNDLAAALTLPAVAAGHLIYLVVTYPGDRAAILTTYDAELLPRVAALEAALTVCETFSALALLLFVVAAYRLHIARCIAVGTTGLWAFAAESTLFSVSSRSPVQRSNLSRAYVLNERAAMTPLMALTGILAVASVTVYVHRHVTSARGKGIESAPSGPAGDGEEGLAGTQERRDATESNQPRSTAAVENQSNRPASFKVVTIASVLFLPLSLLTTVSFPLGAWGITAIGAAHNFFWRLRFFVPESTVAWSELDQAVATGGGFATLLFTLYDAWGGYTAPSA